MTREPRTQHDYGARSVAAARRVLVDLGQVLGSWFEESIVIIGAENRVQLLVAAIPDFLIMKAYALAGRDKPKDAYDLCFCLDHAPGGIEALARAWRDRRESPLVATALAHLQAKFASVSSFGPQQVALFRDAASSEEQAIHARRAFELVARFIALIEK